LYQRLLKKWALFLLDENMMKSIVLKALLPAMLFPSLTLSSEEISSVREYQVKATFLLNFSKFVTYPEKAFSNSEHQICVLGDDPFQGSLSILVKDEEVHGRPIKISYLRDIEAVNKCQALFVSQSEQNRLASIIGSVRQQPILTVSDIENFVTSGGMIQFYILDNNVRFFIDPVTASESELKVSSRLLQVAKVVGK
jgi:hypothetical protein